MTIPTEEYFIRTWDSNSYVYHGAPPARRIRFRLNASHGGEIILRQYLNKDAPAYRVSIGGADNTTCSISANDEKEPLAISASREGGFLREGVYRVFWVDWRDDKITLGEGPEGAANLVQWKSPRRLHVVFIGVRTVHHALGFWALTIPAYPTNRWVGAADGKLVEGAFLAGHDKGGHELYPARAHHAQGLLPGKFNATLGTCHVAWGGKEVHAKHYDLLTRVVRSSWVPMGGGGRATMPPGAVVGGRSETGETLYVGRAKHMDTMTPGKVQPSHGVCYIPYQNNEVSCVDYEVLVEETSSSQVEAKSF